MIFRPIVAGLVAAFLSSCAGPEKQPSTQEPEFIDTVQDRCIQSLAIMKLKLPQLKNTLNVTATVESCPDFLKIKGLDVLGREVIVLEIDPHQYKIEDQMEGKSEQGPWSEHLLEKRFGIPIPSSLFLASLRSAYFPAEKITELGFDPGCTTLKYSRTAEGGIGGLQITSCQGDRLDLTNSQFQEQQGALLPMVQHFKGVWRGKPAEWVLRYKSRNLVSKNTSP